MRTVLVTGGAGFIGSHLTSSLLAQDYRVIVLDDMSRGNWENSAPSTTTRPSSILFQVA